MTTTTAGHKPVSHFSKKSYEPVKFLLASRTTGEASFIKGEDGDRAVQFPITYGVKLQDEVSDEDKGMFRTMRIVKGELSIWADEQTRYKDKELSGVPVDFAIFTNGEFVVDPRNTQLLTFMRKSSLNACNAHMGKKPVFLELNMEKAFEAVLEDENRRATAQEWCAKAPFEDIEAYASFSGFPIANRPQAEVRFWMLNIAKKDPVKFMEGLNNPMIRRHSLISKAIEWNVIKIDPGQNAAYWASGLPIIMAPADQDIKAYLIEQAMTNPQLGERFFIAIKQAIGLVESEKGQESKGKKEMPTAFKEDAVDITVKDVTPVATAKTPVSEPFVQKTAKKAHNLNEVEFLDACKEKELIILKAGRYTMHNFKNDQEPIYHTSKALLWDYLKSEEGRPWLKLAYEVINGDSSIKVVEQSNGITKEKLEDDPFS